MSNENRSNVVIPASVVTIIVDALNTIDTALQPYTTPLTDEERQSLSKMSDKTLAFVTKSHDFSGSNPEFMPAFIQQEDFNTDFSNATNISPLAKRILTTANNLNDTAMVAGSEAYFAARAYYNNVKLGDKSNIANARTIAAELQKRFPGRSKKDNPVPTP